MFNSGMSIIPIKQCSMQTSSHSRFDIVAKAVTYQEDLGCRDTECLDGRIENFAVRLAVTRFAGERDSVEKVQNVQALHHGIYSVVKI